MTKQQYNDRIKEVEELHKINKLLVIQVYAYANNPYKVGDIIRDHSHIIKIERIKFCRPSIGEEFPSCVYHGIELKKDLTPKKNQGNTVMYQTNVLEKIG
jgi:hypothetical protein